MDLFDDEPSERAVRAVNSEGSIRKRNGIKILYSSDYSYVPQLDISNVKALERYIDYRYATRQSTESEATRQASQSTAAHDSDNTEADNKSQDK